jgi:hypothetical protein
VCALLAYNDKE